MNEIKILMWGEFPPNTHTGISVSNELIYNILKSEDIHILKIEENTWNNNTYNKIKNLFYNYFQIIFAISTNKIEIFYFNFPMSKLGLFKLMIILPWIKLISKKTICKGHIHRGDFESFVKSSILNRLEVLINFSFINDIIVLSPSFKIEVNEFYKNINVFVLHNTSTLESKFKCDVKIFRGNYLCLSNYIKSKGLMELVECFKSPELSNFKLNIYGHLYNIKFYNDLKNLASKNISLNKGLSRIEIIDILKKFDCLIIPSWNEGQPIIILEAMSLAIPIIATNVGDIPNMLGENYEFLVEPKNSNSLKQILLRFNASQNKNDISDYLFKRYNTLYSNVNYKTKLLEIFKLRI